jgi:hypothetical protein
MRHCCGAFKARNGKIAPDSRNLAKACLLLFYTMSEFCTIEVQSAHFCSSGAAAKLGGATPADAANR